jgi:hypothetical protein
VSLLATALTHLHVRNQLPRHAANDNFIPISVPD